MIRRFSLVLVGMTLLLSLAPIASQATCYPIPQGLPCPPGALKPGVRLPHLSRFSQVPPTTPGADTINPLIGQVNSQIDGVNTQIDNINKAYSDLPAVTNPIYSVWPETNVLIANLGAGPQASPQQAGARQDGKLYFQNADSVYHLMHEAGCANGGTCRFKDVLLFPGGVAASARFIELKQSMGYRKLGEIVTYQCALHPELTGQFVIS